jgi:hypothetical protein
MMRMKVEMDKILNSECIAIISMIQMMMTLLTPVTVKSTWTSYTGSVIISSLNPMV